MNSFVIIMMVAWIPIVLSLFCLLPARRAVITSFLAAWLFLPMAGFKFAPGIPVYDKMSATCIGVMFGVLLFDTKRLATLRPNWIDLPMALWCLCPFASSLSNDLGPYDGLSESAAHVIAWGLPYLIGRIYFPDLDSLKELAMGLFIGGLIYIPFCLYEIRMSPQLHAIVYGYQQHDFSQTIRLSGWRPMVFMQHGLMVGMWMCMTGLIGFWLWYARTLQSLRRVPAGYLVAALLLTAILCKSFGAILLLLAGITVLFVTTHLRTRLLLWILVLIAPMYMLSRGSGTWDGTMLSNVAGDVSADRADSLDYRMKNEDLLAARALERPVFGWGGWSRSRIFDQFGKDIAVTDGLWIIALGVNGIVGLSAWTLAMLLPPALLIAKTRASWRNPQFAPAIVLAIVIVLYTLDCIPNGMVNPIFTVCLGGLVAIAQTAPILQNSGDDEPTWSDQAMAIGGAN